MDKRIILAVAGAGKTTFIVDNLDCNKRSLILTFTNANYDNIKSKILNRNKGLWPDNITVMTYFSFLYSFCYKPFFSDAIKARGIDFTSMPGRYVTKGTHPFYLTGDNMFYKARIAQFIMDEVGVSKIRERIEVYFDELVIDEIQDFAGRDFSFIEALISVKSNVLYVGDFFQHTYDTSRDGTVNKNLYDDIDSYIKRFTDNGMTCDTSSLSGSWRCSKQVCEFVNKEIGIKIYSNHNNVGEIELVRNPNMIKDIVNDPAIIKLHYNKAKAYGRNHMNWGDSKGLDCFDDVCVLLNKTTNLEMNKNRLSTLKALSKNKLYVAITRAHRNVYLIEESEAVRYLYEQQ